MKIRLSEIPEQGRSFKIDQETGELTNALKDISVADHSLDIRIESLGNHYEMRGQLEADVKITCSQCGEEALNHVEKRLNEILLEAEETPRTSQYARGSSEEESVSFGQVAQSPREVINYQNDSFDLGEYVRESVALELPNYPVCGGKECKNRDEIQAQIAQLNERSEEFGERQGHPGFEALKGLNITRQ